MWKPALAALTVITIGVAARSAAPSAYNIADAKLEITSPKSNSTVAGAVIQISGKGADPAGTLEVDVLTNDWYAQKGEARINADGTFTFAPVYLGGQGQFNNHTIRVTQVKAGKRITAASVEGIRRR
jgi:hypothetical protein